MASKHSMGEDAVTLLMKEMQIKSTMYIFFTYWISKY